MNYITFMPVEVEPNSDPDFVSMKVHMIVRRSSNFPINWIREVTREEAVTLNRVEYDRMVRSIRNNAEVRWFAIELVVTEEDVAASKNSKVRRETI